MGFGEQLLFTECHGVGARVGPIRFSPAGSGGAVYYLTGRVEYGEATLRYGVTRSAGVLWDWFREGMRGVVKRREVSIVMLKPDGVTPEFSVNLTGAWITELRVAPTRADGGDVAIEEIKLIYEGITRDAPGSAG
jgi:phage tail-like protein